MFIDFGCLLVCLALNLRFVSGGAKKMRRRDKNDANVKTRLKTGLNDRQDERTSENKSPKTSIIALGEDAHSREMQLVLTNEVAVSYCISMTSCFLVVNRFWTILKKRLSLTVERDSERFLFFKRY